MLYMLSLSHSHANICRLMVGQRTYDACCMNCVPLICDLLDEAP